MLDQAIRGHIGRCQNLLLSETDKFWDLKRSHISLAGVGYSEFEWGKGESKLKGKGGLIEVDIAPKLADNGTLVLPFSRWQVQILTYLLVLQRQPHCGKMPPASLCLTEQARRRRKGVRGRKIRGRDAVWQFGERGWRMMCCMLQSINRG